MNIRKAFRAQCEIVAMQDLYDLILFVDFNEHDLIVTSQKLYEDRLEILHDKCTFLIKDDFGHGPLTDEMIDSIASKVGANFKRIIGIGSGSILELSKLLSLEKIAPFTDVFKEKIKIKKVRDLILVPTNPGTGSEVTPYASVVIKSLGSQYVLNDDALYASYALLCPDLSLDIPFKIIASSSFDGFIHAFESYLSPIATTFSRALSFRSMELFLKSWLYISTHGTGAINEKIKKLLEAGAMGGVSYANAGCAAIHALAYPLSVRLKIAHGEANYIVFFDVVNIYYLKKPLGLIDNIAELIASILGCNKDESFKTLERLCNNILMRKRLSSYGMRENQILEFTDMVMTRQNMLIANGYVPLTVGEIADIYKNLI